MSELTTAMKAAIEASEVRRAPMVFLDFPDGPIRVWGGIGNLQWDGHVWLGIGESGGINGIEQALELKASKVTLEMSGIPIFDADGSRLFDIVDTVLTQDYQGRYVEIRVAFFDEDWLIIPDPRVIWLGRMDEPSIRHDGETFTVQLTAEHELADMARARERRYTLKDQQERYAEDRGTEYVPGLQEVEIVWGRQKYNG